MAARHFVQKRVNHVTSKLGNQWQPKVDCWELEVVPPEGQSVWDASYPWADQTGCQVAVPKGVKLTTGPVGRRLPSWHPKSSFTPHQLGESNMHCLEKAI